MPRKLEDITSQGIEIVKGHVKKVAQDVASALPSGLANLPVASALQLEALQRENEALRSVNKQLQEVVSVALDVLLALLVLHKQRHVRV